MQPRLKRAALLLALALQGCSLAPTYNTPTLDVPAHYREQSGDGPWRTAPNLPTSCHRSGGGCIPG